MADFTANTGGSERERERVSLAIETISAASLPILIELRDRVTTMIGGVNRRLAESDGSLYSLFLEKVSKSRKNIEEFLQKPKKKLLERKWITDPRLTDIKRTTAVTDDERFLAFLGERSLALEKEGWEKWRFGSSRVDTLVQDLNSSRDHNGSAREFLEFKGFPQDKFVYEALLRGQRYVVNERLCYSARGSSAIYAFKGSDFRRIKFNLLPLLQAHLIQSHQDILTLLESKSSRLDEWQYSYDDGANHIIRWVGDGPKFGLPIDPSATRIPLLGEGHDGSNIRVSEIPEEIYPHEEVGHPIHNASRQTRSKRRRSNIALSDQGGAPSQHGSRHLSGEVQGQAEGAVTANHTVPLHTAYNGFCGTDYNGQQLSAEPGSLPSATNHHQDNPQGNLGSYPDINPWQLSSGLDPISAITNTDAWAAQPNVFDPLSARMYANTDAWAAQPNGFDPQSARMYANTDAWATQPNGFDSLSTETHS